MIPLIPTLRSRSGLLNDLHAYDPVAMAWTDLSTAISGEPPSPRWNLGFAAAGGRLYAHGGCSQLTGTRLCPLGPSYSDYVNDTFLFPVCLSACLPVCPPTTLTTSVRSR